MAVSYTWTHRADYLVCTDSSGNIHRYNTMTSYQARRAVEQLQGMAPPRHIQPILDRIPARPR